MESVILAHQGGWDEALMVAVPIAVFVLLLRLANRRAKAIQAGRDAAAASAAAEPSENGTDQ